MLDKNDVLSTVQMIDRQHLDIRTITMGISLLSCADRDAKAKAEADTAKAEAAKVGAPAAGAGEKSE